MSDRSIDQFLSLLKKSPRGAVFNPWWQVDEENDIGQQAPRIRREQLRAYFGQRLGTARLAVIGEAVGYRGGHFTGIAMTSERILLEGIGGLAPSDIVSGITPRRTSKPEKCARGFAEPTATIIWETLLRLGLRPDQFVLWNAFPWHSFDPRRGVLSNRTPKPAERAAGLPVLQFFLELFRCDRMIALGRIAAAQLEDVGVEAHCVRHPASGGARLFRQQIAEFASKLI
jgi:uracil-DNA glycosylase